MYVINMSQNRPCCINIIYVLMILLGKKLHVTRNVLIVLFKMAFKAVFLVISLVLICLLFKVTAAVPAKEAGPAATDPNSDVKPDTVPFTKSPEVGKCQVS